MSDETTAHKAAPTAFHDLGTFIALPRVSSLVLSPTGDRLVASVAELASEGTRYITALWEIDPAGQRPSRRLTRSAKGESAPAFTPEGTLLFLSARPDTDPAKDAPEDGDAALWALPADGGEAFRLVGRPGGIDGFTAARRSGRIALAASLLPGADDAEGDAALRKARKEAKVSAILHEESAVRYWDHDLGPGVPHVFTLPEASSGQTAVDCGVTSTYGTSQALSADGVLLAHTVDLGDTVDEQRSGIAVVDAATGKRLRLIADPDANLGSPVFTADGRTLVCSRESLSSWDLSTDVTLHAFDVPDGSDPSDRLDRGRDLLPGFDLWPGGAVPSPAGNALFFTADQLGRSPVFRLDTGDGTLTRLTADGCYSDLSVSPDGTALFALRSAVDAPPTPVRLDSSAADQDPVALLTPAPVGALPGSLTEVTATAEDGTALRSWLVLPDGADASAPVPLLLWVHGGPQSSWNAWTWRWNPWVAAAAGYAVLLPDPALSTGYSQRMHQRGWGDWGGNPYTDVITLTDAALERPDLDATRTAMMGGSFGGYMANLIATRTDRFKAIVSHASLWNLHTFTGTTDAPHYWRRQYGDVLKTTERYDALSPHLHAARISTPMLVVHGDRDYRVPIGEALGLWTDLVRFGVPAKFLYYPDEGHWILKPNNSRLWYATVLAFLAHHVLGEEWRRPDLV